MEERHGAHRNRTAIKRQTTGETESIKSRTSRENIFTQLLRLLKWKSPKYSDSLSRRFTRFSPPARQSEGFCCEEVAFQETPNCYWLFRFAVTFMKTLWTGIAPACDILDSL